MRGLVPGLQSAYPLGPTMPALYHDDDFAQRFLAGLDEVLAPIFSTIDNLDAYLDPRLTPDDFLSWLAGWVGISLDEGWDEGRRRAIVARAVELYRMRGTAAGLAGQVEIQTGGKVEIVENGATGWSVDPGGELPGLAEPLLVVRVTVPDPKAVDAQRLDTLVATAKPAHVVHRIEIVKDGGSGHQATRPPPRGVAREPAPEQASPPEESSPPEGEGSGASEPAGEPGEE